MGEKISSSCFHFFCTLTKSFFLFDVEFPDCCVELEDFLLLLVPDLDFELLVEATTGLTFGMMVEAGRLEPAAITGWFRAWFSEVEATLGITLEVKSHERLVKSLSVSSSMMSV